MARDPRARALANHPTFADSNGPLLYRTRFELRTACRRTARRWSRFDGVFYQADVWLDGAYLGDPEGYFFPHTLRHHRARPARRRTRAGRRGDLHAAARSASQAQHHRRVPALGVVRPRRGTRAACGARCGIYDTGPVRIDRLRVLCRDADDARAHLRLSRAARQRRAADRHASARSIDGAPLDRARHTLARRRATRSSGPSTSTNPALWWPWSLGDQPLTEVSSRGGRRRRGQRPTRTCAPGCARSACNDWVFSVNGERLFLKGANLAADAQWTSPTRRPASCARRRAGPRGRPRRVARARPHRPSPSCTTPPTSSACCSGRTSRCSGAMPARSAARRSTRRGPPSICSATIRRSPCGAATTNRRIEPRPSAPAAAQSVHRRATAAVVEQDDARPLGEAGVRAGRRDAPGRSPTRGVVPHLPQLDGTDSHLYFGWYHGDERDLPGFAAAVPRMVRFVSEFGAAGGSRRRRLHGADTPWPDLDWELLEQRHGLQRDTFDKLVPPAEYATFDDWRDRDAALSGTVLRHHIETLRRLKYRPTGGFCLSSLVTTPTTVIVERARPRAPPEVGVSPWSPTPAGR